MCDVRDTNANIRIDKEGDGTLSMWVIGDEDWECRVRGLERVAVVVLGRGVEVCTQYGEILGTQIQRTMSITARKPLKAQP